MSRYLVSLAALGIIIAGCDRDAGRTVGTNANIDTSRVERGVDTERNLGTGKEVGPGRTDTSGARSVSGQSTQPGASDAAHAADATANGVNFMREAASGNRMEVELGQVASRRAENSRVKEFGQKMVDDHEQANQQLMSLARSQQIDVQAGMVEKHQLHVTHLSSLQGREFDEAYMGMMVNDHQEVIRLYEDQSRNTQNAELRSFAEKTLPTLREHLRMAQEIQSSMGAADRQPGR